MKRKYLYWTVFFVAAPLMFLQGESTNRAVNPLVTFIPRETQIIFEKTLPVATASGLRNISFVVSKDRVFDDYAYYVSNKNTNHAYLCVWTPQNLACLSLVNCSGKAYLSWMDDLTLCLSELVNYSSSANGSQWGGIPSSSQADHAINLKSFQDADLHFKANDGRYELTVISITNEAGSGLSLTATNHLGKFFKFSRGRNMWRAFGEAGEIKRSDPTNRSPENIFPPPNKTGNETVLLSFSLTLKNQNQINTNINASFVSKIYQFRIGGIPISRCFVIAPDCGNLALAHEAWIKAGPYTRPGNATVVKIEPGTANYLAFTDGENKLFLNKLASTLPPERDCVDDPEVGVLSSPKEDFRFRGKMDYIIDMAQFDNWQRFFKGGGGVASAKQENNVLTLTVTNASGSKFTFSNQDGQWHAYSFWGEIKRVKL